MFIASSMHTVLSEQFIVASVGTIEVIQLSSIQSSLVHVTWSYYCSRGSIYRSMFA